MPFALKGVQVAVLRPTFGESDPFGAPVQGEPERIDVGNVLVDSPSGEDLESSVRQFGTACDLKLHFPKGFRGDLRGCSVEIPAPWSGVYEVLGDPKPFDPSLTPGEHGMAVSVRRVSG